MSALDRKAITDAGALYRPKSDLQQGLAAASRTQHPRLYRPRHRPPVRNKAESRVRVAVTSAPRGVPNMHVPIGRGRCNVRENHVYLDRLFKKQSPVSPGPWYHLSSYRGCGYWWMPVLLHDGLWGFDSPGPQPSPFHNRNLLTKNTQFR